MEITTRMDLFVQEFGLLIHFCQQGLPEVKLPSPTEPLV